MDISDSSGPSSSSPDPPPRSERPLTMAQLAKHVGVSPSAVSVVLSNTNSRIKVSAATRQRILDAARELNYRPNVVARSLRKQQTNIIGFYKSYGDMLDPEYPFFSALLRGVLAGCRSEKKNLLLYGQPGSSSEDDISLEILNGLLDGLVLYSWGTEDLTERLVASHLPVITVADEVSGLPSVVVDDEMGGRLLVRYLVEKGYQRALYWCALEPMTSSVAKRYASYVQEASQLGLNLEVFHEEEPYEPALKMIMARKNPPDVISAYSDEVAHQIIEALNSLGFQVPRDVAVTGFDGFPGVYPEITTIRAPWRQVAHTAVSLLSQNGDGHPIPLQTILPVALQVGETA